MASIKTDVGYTALPVNLKRGNPIPLDTTAVWYDYEALETYAQSGATAYVGQIVSYVDQTNNTTSVYVITDTSGTLTPVGAGEDASATNVDNNTIALDGEGFLSLRDYGTVYYRYVEAEGVEGSENYKAAHYERQEVDEEHPWKQGLTPQVVIDPEDDENFILGWYEPNPTTLEGINTQLTAINNELDTLSNNLKNNYFSKEQLAGVLHLKGSVNTKQDLYENLDGVPSLGDVYLVKDTGQEFVYVNNAWEEIGTTVDLSAYATLSYVDGKVGDLNSTIGTIDGRVGTLETKHNTLSNTVSTMNTSLNGVKSEIVTLGGDVETLKTAVGKPATESTVATGLYAVIAQEIGKSDHLVGISIDGTDVPISEKKAQLSTFKGSEVGLVPVPSMAVSGSSLKTQYVLNAVGNWVLPQDSRVGSLLYDGVAYDTVTEYVNARTESMVMTWSKIVE